MAQKIVIDSKEFIFDELTSETQKLVVSIRYAEERIKEVNKDIALATTALNTYGLNLSGKLPKEAHPNKKKGVVSVNGKRYVLDDFDEVSKGNLYSMDHCSKQISRLNNDLAILKTALTTYTERAVATVK